MSEQLVIYGGTEIVGAIEFNSASLTSQIYAYGVSYDPDSGQLAYMSTASFGSGSGGPGSPGGSSTQIQYNDGGAFNGVPTLTYSGGTLRATGSFNGPLAGTASWATNVVNAASINTSSLATTGSNTFRGNQTISGSVTITSSLNVFGNEFVVNSNGVNIGNLVGDSHTITGSLAIAGNQILDGTMKQGVNAVAIGSYSTARGTNAQTGVTTAFSASISASVVTLDSSLFAVNTQFVPGNILYAYRVINGDRFLYTISSSVYNGTNTIVRINENSIFNNEECYVGDIDYGYFVWTGNKTIPGNNSIAEGLSTLSLGFGSHAQGGSTQAIGQYSHTEGISTNAIGFSSHAEGISTKTIGECSHAEGASTKTRAYASHAEGFGTEAIGQGSHTEGNLSISTGQYSHAEGESTSTLGTAAHSEGKSTSAIGNYSHAEGESTVATGIGSHASGYFTNALGNYQSVIGQYNISSSNAGAFIIGNGTSTSNRSNLLFASGSQLQITGSLLVSGSISTQFVTASTTYTASITDSTIDLTGNVTCSLYTATGNLGRQLVIKNGGTGIVTVDASGSQTIDGRLTRRLAARESLLLQSDGTTDWLILNKTPVIHQLGHGSSGISLAANTTYYVGQFYDADPTTTASALTRTTIALSSGWITRMTRMCSVAGTVSGTEDSTLSIRNVTTGTTVTVSSTIEFNVASQLEDFTLATPLQVTRGDQLQVVFTTGNWITAPNSVRQYFNLLIE